MDHGASSKAATVREGRLSTVCLALFMAMGATESAPGGDDTFAE